MSGRRKFSTEFKVEAAHRVIDSGRSVSEVARELTINDMTLGRWVRDERARMEAAKGTELEPLTGVERAELLRLRKQVIEQEKDLLFLGKASAYVGDRCQVPVSLMPVMRFVKMAARAVWPFAQASSRWACRMGANSIVV